MADVLPQLRRILKMNRTHPELPRTLQIQLPVINEQTFFPAALYYFERHAVLAASGVAVAGK